jgi:hypothetical protein
MAAAGAVALAARPQLGHEQGDAPDHNRRGYYSLDGSFGCVGPGRQIQRAAIRMLPAVRL